MTSMTRTAPTRLHGDGGYMLVFVAFLLPVLLIVAAFAVDYGHFTNSGDRAQRAADQASLAAVTEYVRVDRATGTRPWPRPQQT